MDEMNKIKTNSVVQARQGTRTKTQGNRTFWQWPRTNLMALHNEK